MAEEKKPAEKTLEMRVAELEDKLSKIHITEDELKAYHKVSSLMAGGAVAQPEATAQLSPQVCSISRVVPRSIRQIINRQIFECSCGPCNPEGGSFGGNFGGFGS
jgi:hypothetical protein